MALHSKAESKSSANHFQEHYNNGEGKLFFRRSFCSYLDILGFSEKIKENNLDYFTKYLNTLNTELMYIEDNHDLSGKQGFKSFELKIFTDNFIFGHPWFDEFGESELGDIFMILSHLQLTFVKSDIFLRGAISVSDLFMDDNIVLGPALIESYKLETEKAIYPRIIISKDVVEIINKHINYYSERTTSPQNQHYLIDIDGVYFVNYLFVLLHFEDSPIELNVEDIIEDLIQHKIAILTNLNLHKNNYKVFDKYSWSAKYHNFFCDIFFKPRFPETDLSKIKIDENFYKKIIRKIAEL